MISDIRKELIIKKDLMKFKKQIMSTRPPINSRSLSNQGLSKSNTVQIIANKRNTNQSILSDDLDLEDPNEMSI